MISRLLLTFCVKIALKGRDRGAGEYTLENMNQIYASLSVIAVAVLARSSGFVSRFERLNDF